MKFPTRTVLMIVAIMIGGCTAEPTSLAPPSKPEKRPVSVDGSPANNPPIIRSAGIYPANVSLESTLQVDIQGEDKDGDPIQYQYQWVVNGLPLVDATGPQFLTAQLKKGDEIGVDLIPSDGKVNGAVFKASLVKVGNTAPRIDEIQMEPAPVHRGEILKARVVARDPDGDLVQLSYKWFLNGKELPGQQTDALDTKPFRKKDVLRVLVTPSDGQAAREPLAGPPVTIENAPPRITSTPSTAVNDGQYLYQVIATDPDEDTISYELKEAPSGMTIEAATGKLVWRLTPESKGKQHVVIVAKDNENAHTEQDFELEGQTPAQLEAQTPATPLVTPSAPQ